MKGLATENTLPAMFNGEAETGGACIETHPNRTDPLL